MPVDDNEPAMPERRINARSRRSGGGFSSGTSTVSESLRTVNEEDDDDDLIDDPADMQNRVFDQRDISPMDGSPNPRQRMNEVAMSGSQAYSKEYRLTLLHRMLMRNIPLDQIARELKVSISTIEKDRVLLKARLREQSRGLNIDELVGNQQGVYDELRGMAMRIASDVGGGRSIDGTLIPGQTAPIRLAAMRTALAAEADRIRFLNSAGVFDVMHYRRAEDGSDISDVQRLMDKTNEMLERIMGDESETPAPRKRITRTGGFTKFTMDDKDASSGDAEHVEL